MIKVKFNLEKEKKMKILTAWHQVPVLGCLHRLCENCVDIVSKEMLVSAVTFEDTVYVLGLGDCIKDLISVNGLFLSSLRHSEQM